MLEPGCVLGAASRHALELAGLGLWRGGDTACVVAEARETVVVTSRTRVLAEEVYLERCRADGVPVLVRPSGGGTVVLAPGVVAASVLEPVRAGVALPDACFAHYCGLVAGALGRLGVAVEMRGVSDLCAGDRKVAGSALRVSAGQVLFQVAVLVDLDLGVIERYLPLPPRQPRYRAGRGHADFLLTLRGAGFEGSCEAVVRALEGALRGVGNAVGPGATALGARG